VPELREGAEERREKEGGGGGECTAHTMEQIFFLISNYTNFLVNADSFYTNFTNTNFQKEPRYMYLMRIPSLTHT
jgi:hypothetical protein